MSIAIGIAAAYGLVFALLGIAVWRINRKPRPSTAQRVAEASARVGLPAPDERDFIADLEAQMKAYGNTVAAFYDTTTGDQ